MKAKLRLYHYTSRQGAQDIVASNSLRAGPSRVIYLTTDMCDTGSAAAATLAIHGKPVEVRCEVKANPQHLRGPFRVETIFGSDGTLLRPGGGVEYKYLQVSLDLEGQPQWELLRSP